MSFIGILTNTKNENVLKHAFKQTDGETRIYYLHEDNINNMKNIKFETILIGKEVEQKKEPIKNLVKKAKYLIFNSDRKENMEFLENLNVIFITYGFNSKATVTASSIEKEQAIFYVQRGVKLPSEELIEPQEIKLEVKEDDDIYGRMEEVSLKLLYPNLYKKVID